MLMTEQTNANRIIAGELHEQMTFDQRVWALTARIPPGRVATYAQIAHQLHTRAYRAVGRALNRNPYAPQVPCHRVVASTGRLGGFAHGLEAKKALLQNERIQIENDRIDLTRFGHRF